MGHLILRVDDVGWLPPEKTQDTGLQYFAKWREAMGCQGLPAYYGVIPSCVGPEEIRWLQDNLTGGEEVAVHGHDHVRHALITDAQMLADNLRLEKAPRCRCYIAPFNEYTEGTIRQWGRVAINGYFFGGFYPEHHKLGNVPTNSGGCYHLPAWHPTYDHTEPLLRQLPDWLDLDCPLVVTLHATWGWNRLLLLGDITELIKPHLVPVDFVNDWAARSTLSLARLTAPHFLAYQWICNRLTKLPLGQTVLDFGARYSELACQMALRGHRVTAFDRDPNTQRYQEMLAAKLGATITTANTREINYLPGQYNVITACWAIQHNLPAPDKIPGVVRELARLLKPKGRLLIVSSFSPGGTYEQQERQDPQAVLSMADHRKLIIEPSGLKPTYPYPEFFSYQHGTSTGSFCGEADANAICYELQKE